MTNLTRGEFVPLVGDPLLAGKATPWVIGLSIRRKPNTRWEIPCRSRDQSVAPCSPSSSPPPPTGGVKKQSARRTRSFPASAGAARPPAVLRHSFAPARGRPPAPQDLRVLKVTRFVSPPLLSFLPFGSLALALIERPSINLYSPTNDCPFNRFIYADH